MKIFILICITSINISCEQFKLIPTEAENLKNKISTYRGKKAIILNVWALWCKPCIEEFPMLVDFHNTIEDLEVIFVSADFEDEFKEVSEFLSNYNIGSFSYIKSQKDEIFINEIHPNWSGSLPFTIIYAKKSGEIIDYWEGKEKEKIFKEAIRLALSL